MSERERWLVDAGQWLFRHRSITVLPIISALVYFYEQPHYLALMLVLIGEMIRWQAVSVIGNRSRTRQNDIGVLCTTGLYSVSRNPLYIGNGFLWLGVLLFVGKLVIFIPSVLVLYLQYHLIICWEESMLRKVHGEAYNRYCEQTNRYWQFKGYIPRQKASWKTTLRSERSTISSIVGVFTLLEAVRCI